VSLEGPAGQVLWELPPGASTAQLERLLQTWFGTELQAESYHAKLHTWCRDNGETLQDLYRDISRLLQLAYPGMNSTLLNHVGIDSFIAALNDRDLEYEVLKRDPASLQVAANYAIKLEVYWQSLNARTTVSAERGSGQGLSQSRNVFAVADEPEASSIGKATLLKHLEQIKKQLEKVAKGNRNARNSSSRKASSNPGASALDVTSRGKSDSADSERARPSPETHPCTYCKELGHWRRDCPKRKARGRQTEEANVQTVLAVSANLSPTKIYVTAEINGEPVRCLLDSGCEWPVINADLVPQANFTPSQYSLFAANKASLDVIDDAVVSFAIDGQQFEAEVSVSEKVDEFLLGSDWLEQQGATWNFASGTVTLGDQSIRVHHRHRASICRRVVVTHDCVIPTKHTANVSVHMEDEGIPLPPSDWAIEPQGLRPGVMAAHTLFSNSQSQLVAYILNNSLEDKSLRANSFLSVAALVQCISGIGEVELSNALFADSGDSSDGMLVDESVVPVSPSLRPTPVKAEGAELRASSVSSSTADSMDPDSSTLPAGMVCDHIDSLLCSLPLDLSDDQRHRTEAFIRSHANVFSRSEFDIGRTNIIPHRIDTSDNSPHFEQLRRHLTAQLPVIDEHVQHMLEHDVIEPAASLWCSNVVMVCNQDGTM